MAQLPRARRTGLIIEKLPNETLVYDSERDSAMCLNQTAGSVWEHCDGKTTQAQMSRLLEKELQIASGDEMVTLALEQLEKAHLLTTKSVAPRSGMSRREAVRRFGITAAALPVIAMIQVKPAGTVTSCTPNEGSCVQDGQCCSGCCSDLTCVPASNCFKT